MLHRVLLHLCLRPPCNATRARAAEKKADAERQNKCQSQPILGWLKALVGRSLGWLGISSKSCTPCFSVRLSHKPIRQESAIATSKINSNSSSNIKNTSNSNSNSNTTQRRQQQQKQKRHHKQKRQHPAKETVPIELYSRGAHFGEKL